MKKIISFFLLLFSTEILLADNYLFDVLTKQFLFQEEQTKILNKKINEEYELYLLLFGGDKVSLPAIEKNDFDTLNKIKKKIINNNKNLFNEKFQIDFFYKDYVKKSLIYSALKDNGNFFYNIASILDKNLKKIQYLERIDDDGYVLQKKINYNIPFDTNNGHLVKIKGLNPNEFFEFNLSVNVIGKKTNTSKLIFNFYNNSDDVVIIDNEIYINILDKFNQYRSEANKIIINEVFVHTNKLSKLNKLNFSISFISFIDQFKVTHKKCDYFLITKNHNSLSAKEVLAIKYKSFAINNCSNKNNKNNENNENILINIKNESFNKKIYYNYKDQLIKTDQKIYIGEINNFKFNGFKITSNVNLSQKNQIIFIYAKKKGNLISKPIIYESNKLVNFDNITEKKSVILFYFKYIFFSLIPLIIILLIIFFIFSLYKLNKNFYIFLIIPLIILLFDNSNQIIFLILIYLIIAIYVIKKININIINFFCNFQIIIIFFIWFFFVTQFNLISAICSYIFISNMLILISLILFKKKILYDIFKK